MSNKISPVVNQDKIQVDIYFDEEFGKLEPEEYRAVSGARQELCECDGCTGLPCRKKSGQNFVPHIKEVKGWVYRVHVSYGYCDYYEAERKQRALARKIRDARIPLQYVGKTLEDYTVDRNNEIAVAYAKNALQSGRGAFLFGERGAGKTFLAAIIAQEYVKAGKSVVFVKVPTLLDDLRATYNGWSEIREQDLLREVYEADLLVLDDFGMEKPTRFAGTTLCKIIDRRYDDMKATLITSNYSLEKVQSELDNATDGKNYNGSRIADRCLEMCMPILLKGSSRRGQ